MKTYENNMADQALVVKRLKVLESIDGGPVREIKQTVESVRKQTNAISRQQDEYWKTLSDDGIITPIEKQSLLRESKNIDRSFAAITQQAATLGIASAILEDYIATYDALHAYLFTTLKLFDDMQSETQIDDRDTFNAYFSGYYFSENFVLLAITAGILDTIDFRVLQSLTEPGEEGETAIYHGALYQYVNGQWKNVTTGAYKGPRTELPADEEEAFFIVSESFTMSESLIVNDEELLVNGDTLLVTHTYLKGYIYYFQAGTWHPEFDKTNWRYAAAFADVLNITGELPQIFQDGLDAIQANLDAAVLTLEDEIAAKQGQYTIIGGEMVLIDDLLPQIIDDYNEQQTEIDSKVSHLPVYYGGTSTTPASPQEGDFYLFTGSGENNCKVRRYHNAAWEWLDPSNTNYRNYYMMALEDILANSGAGTATFSNAFAQNFWAACANMNTLDVQTIFLRNNGAIQSSNLTYSEEDVGLRIDSDGNIDANGNTHIKGKVAIGVPLAGNTDFNTYDTVIGGDVLLKEDAVLKGALITDNIQIKKTEIQDVVLYQELTPTDLDVCNFVMRTRSYGTDNQGSEYTFDYTLPDNMYINFTGINTILYSYNIKRIQMSFLETTPRALLDGYIKINIQLRNDTWINNFFNYGNNWEERHDVTSSLSLKMTGSNYTELTMKNLRNIEPDTDDVLWNDNGILKLSNHNLPIHLFDYPAGTRKSTIASDLLRYIKNNSNVGCIGFYGSSTSSSNNSLSYIRVVDYIVSFYNVNETRKLEVTTFGDETTNERLCILFVYDKNI